MRLLEGCKISLRRFNFLFFFKGMKRESLFWSANLAFASRVITLLDQSESFPPRWFCTWLREKRNDVIAWLRQRVFLLYVPFPHDPRKFSSRFYLFIFSLKKKLCEDVDVVFLLSHRSALGKRTMSSRICFFITFGLFFFFFFFLIHIAFLSFCVVGR